jgi:alpha-N-arabinofuranosidase
MQGASVLGRETFLAPVQWHDSWPVIGNQGTVELEFPAPQLPPSTSAGRRASGVGRRRASPWLTGWSTRHFPVGDLRVDGDRIEVPVTAMSLDGDGAVSAAFLRQTEHAASFRATVTAVPDGATAGITAYTAPEHHYDLLLTGRRVTLRRRAADLVAESSVGLPGEGPSN